MGSSPDHRVREEGRPKGRESGSRNEGNGAPTTNNDIPLVDIHEVQLYIQRTNAQSGEYAVVSAEAKRDICIYI